MKYPAIGIFAIVSLLAVGILIWQRVSDGPYGPLQGGPFRAGELVSQPITDWSFLPADDIGEIQLVSMARRWIAPAVLAPAPAEPQNDIWFFEFESNPAAIGERATAL